MERPDTGHRSLQKGPQCAVSNQAGNGRVDVYDIARQAAVECQSPGLLLETRAQDILWCSLVLVGGADTMRTFGSGETCRRFGVSVVTSCSLACIDDTFATSVWCIHCGRQMSHNFVSFVGGAVQERVESMSDHPCQFGTAGCPWSTKASDSSGQPSRPYIPVISTAIFDVLTTLRRPCLRPKSNLKWSCAQQQARTT